MTAVAEVALPAKLIRQPPVRIDTLLTKDQFVSLARHMLNENPISHFLVVHRDGDGQARYSKARPHKRAYQHAGWAWDTMTGKASIKTSLGFYAKNKDNHSTWSVLDFDAHSGGQELETQKDRAVRAFTLLLEYRDRHLILSASGRGYHVFVFAREPRPVHEWTELLKDTVALLPDGQCEMFPADGTERQKVGKAIRMPGTYNPATDSVELIIAETIGPLLDHIECSNSATLTSNSNPPSVLVRDRETDSSSYSISFPSSEGKTYVLDPLKEVDQNSTKIASKTQATGFISTSTDRLIGQILEKYPVTQKGTRHGALIKMAGELFHKFGWELSKYVAREHYRRYRENISSTEDVHLREFAKMWEDILDNTTSTFSASEREIYGKLNGLPQQEAFLIIRSFAHLASGNDFPVAQLSLGDRLRVSQQGAGWIIDKLIQLKAIEKTAPPKINSKSTRYRWIANKDELPLGGINVAVNEDPF
jgi:hypothetical protein